jgi:hypothetical protein
MVSSHAAEATPAAAAVVTYASSSGVALRCGGSAAIGAANWGSHCLLVQPSLIFGNARGCGWSRERFRLPSRGQDQETPERSVSFPIGHMHPPLLIR